VDVATSRTVTVFLTVTGSLSKLLKKVATISAVSSFVFRRQTSYSVCNNDSKMKRKNSKNRQWNNFWFNVCATRYRGI